MLRSLLAAMAACALVPATSVAATHTVAPGETLWGIAYANNLPTSAVAAANGLSTEAQGPPRHEPDHPRAGAGPDPSGQRGALLTRHRLGAGGLGRRRLSRRHRRHAERDRRPPWRVAGLAGGRQRAEARLVGDSGHDAQAAGTGQRAGRPGGGP